MMDEIRGGRYSGYNWNLIFSPETLAMIGRITMGDYLTMEADNGGSTGPGEYAIGTEKGNEERS